MSYRSKQMKNVKILVMKSQQQKAVLKKDDDDGLLQIYKYVSIKI